MKKAFISVSFKKKNDLSQELTIISELLKKHKIKPFIFVNNYVFVKNKEKEMMKKATKAIANSDILIAELTDKAIGVGIEIGYAYALKKKIIYLRKERTEYSRTTGGVASEQITYNNMNDLKSKLEIVLSAM